MSAVSEVSTASERVTYVLTKHVQPSQTFVRGEIAELRRQGVAVDVVSVERGDAPPDAGEQVLFLCDRERSRGELWREHAAAAARRPVGYLRFAVLVVLLRGEMGTGPEKVPWWLLPGVAREVRRSGSRALHAHFGWSGAAAACLLSALTGRPWSVTLHAKDIFSKQRNLRHKLRTADRLVTVCDYNLAWMRTHLGLRRPVALVVCGVTAPPADERPVTGADVVAVGRLVPKKGFDTLLRAAADLPGVTMDVIGEGPERARLEALSDELDLGARVRLLGARSHAESLARIAGAQVMCLPARVAEDGDRDSMPVVIKEAMVRGVPVVASDVAAIPEMLSDGCGVMVGPDDPAALASALRSVLTDPALAASTSAAARSRVADRFTLEGETARLREILLHGPRRRLV